MEDKPTSEMDFGGYADETWRDKLLEKLREDFGYVPNYPKHIDTNPFNLIEGNENKLY